MLHQNIAMAAMINKEIRVERKLDIHQDAVSLWLWCSREGGVGNGFFIIWDICCLLGIGVFFDSTEDFLADDDIDFTGDLSDEEDHLIGGTLGVGIAITITIEAKINDI